MQIPEKIRLSLVAILLTANTGTRSQWYISIFDPYKIKTRKSRFLKSLRYLLITRNRFLHLLDKNNVSSAFILSCF